MLRTLIFSILLGLAPVAGTAQGTEVSFGTNQDTSQPVEVTADALAVDQDAGTALYTGNVVVIQGDMRLAAPRVLVIFVEEEDRIDRMEATGGVTMVSGEEAAEAERADYDVEAGMVDMQGDVLVTQGPQVVSSERMLVDLDTGKARMTGRVRTVLQRDRGN